jgi:hypothetical protein
MNLLSKVTSGIQKRPYYLLMHGLPGIGKSSFAAEAPKPIFLCAEKGTNHLNVSRLELSSFAEFKAAIKELAETNHDFKTVVIDTVDHVEPLIFKEVLKDKGGGKTSIEDIGYAKGYIFALEYWQQLIHELEALRDSKGMNVILLAHTEVKAFNDPQLTEAYDRYQVKLHHKAAGLIIDRVEGVLFANYKAFLHKADGGKSKALGDGSRVIYTEHRPSFVAKNRHDLPFELPLSWADFVLATETKGPKSSELVLGNINELMDQIKDAELKKKVEAHLEKVKASPVELLKVLNRLKTIVAAA